MAHSEERLSNASFILYPIDTNVRNSSIRMFQVLAEVDAMTALLMEKKGGEVEMQVYFRTF